MYWKFAGTLYKNIIGSYNKASLSSTHNNIFGSPPSTACQVFIEYLRARQLMYEATRTRPVPLHDKPSWRKLISLTHSNILPKERQGHAELNSVIKVWSRVAESRRSPSLPNLWIRLNRNCFDSCQDGHVFLKQEPPLAQRLSRRPKEHKTKAIANRAEERRLPGR